MSYCQHVMIGLCDGYVKYKEAEVNRSAIMQDFRDNGKTTIKNGRLAAIGSFLCETLYILFYIHGPAIWYLFSYLNITKLLKFKMAAKRPF